MAIIPAEEKVFMVSNSTNTIYSGSASLKAMQQWYTMQDVIDSVGNSGAITLQKVTEAGNTTNQTIYAEVNEGIGVYGSSGSDTGVYGASEFGNGVRGSSNEGYGGFFNSSEGYGGYFTSQNNIGLFVSSDYNPGVYGQSIESRGVWGTSEVDYGVYGSSDTGFGGYFTSNENYSLVAAQSAAKPGGGSWDAYSDSRVKEDVRPYAKGLTEILLVNPVNYKYNGLASTIKDIEYTGVIAQEIKDIFPETVGIYKAKLNEEDEEKTELYSFNSTALTFALINAVKELNEKIKILEAK